MKELKPQQTVLAAVLASFVVSIATTVITISLTTEPEVPLRQTVNHVVERTVERVIEAPENQPAQTALVLGEQDQIDTETPGSVDAKLPEPYHWPDLVQRLRERITPIYAIKSEQISHQGIAIDENAQVVVIPTASTNLRLEASLYEQSESQAVVRLLHGVTLLQTNQGFAVSSPDTKLFAGEEIIVLNDSSAGFAVFVVGEYIDEVEAYKTTACHADSIGTVTMDSRGNIAGICGTQDEGYYLYPLSRFATMQPALSANPEFVFSSKP